MHRPCGNACHARKVPRRRFELLSHEDTSFRDWRLTGLGYLGRSHAWLAEEALKSSFRFKRLQPRTGGIPTEVTLRGRFDKSPRRIELSRSHATVEEVLRADGKRPDAVVVLRGPTPIPIPEAVRDGEELQVLEVVSGG